MDKEDEILKSLDEIKRHLGIGLPFTMQEPPDSYSRTVCNCTECGLDLCKTMGYVCANPKCPCGLGGVTCG
jgi:hypothetical protein